MARDDWRYRGRRPRSREWHGGQRRPRYRYDRDFTGEGRTWEESGMYGGLSPARWGYEYEGGEDRWSRPYGRRDLGREFYDDDFYSPAESPRRSRSRYSRRRVGRDPFIGGYDRDFVSRPGGRRQRDYYEEGGWRGRSRRR